MASSLIFSTVAHELTVAVIYAGTKLATGFVPLEKRDNIGNKPKWLEVAS